MYDNIQVSHLHPLSFICNKFFIVLLIVKNIRETVTELSYIFSVIHE